MDWNEALKAARDEHRELLQKRDELDAQRAEIDFEVEKIDQRAVQLQHTIASLAELTGANKMPSRVPSIDVSNLHLANACRAVLSSSNKFWTPVSVRDHLLSLDYDLTPYTNHLASIHAVLKRLIDSGEAIRTAGPDGKAMYRWKGSAAFPQPGETINDGMNRLIREGARNAAQSSGGLEAGLAMFRPPTRKKKE
ncbi:MAG TPA: hypothetical protein VJU86_22520 [Pyrinomonadaceae bacterium]|nr:hypothetical protein [Pyrinomonadaceae bacterium]